MRKLLIFVREECVLCAALFLALASMLLVPPDRCYTDYIDYKTLLTLFCLMASVAGLRGAGVFSWLAGWICQRVHHICLLSLLLTLVCFFGAALITNDVTLITFVPFTIYVLGSQDQRRLIYVIVIQTIAANLGSVLLPMGNPQNLLLYHRFSYTVGTFAVEMLPLWVLSLCVCIALSLAVPVRGNTTVTQPHAVTLHGKSALCWGVSFAVSTASVCGFLPVYLSAALALFLAVLWRQEKILRQIDFSLLATFVCLFVFVGNIARIESVRIWIQNILSGRELLVSTGLSQLISNVPATAMLVSFTEQARALLYGVNIGGLGTLIASMASLISYRRYCTVERAEKGRYLLCFSVVNFGLLVVFLAFGMLYLRLF